MVVSRRRKRGRAQSTLVELERLSFSGAPPPALTHKLEQLGRTSKPDPEMPTKGGGAKPRARVYDDAFDMRRAKSSCRASTKNTTSAATKSTGGSSGVALTRQQSSGYIDNPTI